jgi:hypothetical protein
MHASKGVSISLGELAHLAESRKGVYTYSISGLDVDSSRSCKFTY